MELNRFRWARTELYAGKEKSIKQVAQKIGVSHSIIDRLEKEAPIKERTGVQYQAVRDLAALYKVSSDWLLELVPFDEFSPQTNEKEISRCTGLNSLSVKVLAELSADKSGGDAQLVLAGLNMLLSSGKGRSLIAAIYEYASAQFVEMGEYGSVELEDGKKIAVRMEDISMNPAYRPKGITFRTKEGKIIKISEKEIGTASLLRRVDARAKDLRDEVQQPEKKIRHKEQKKEDEK